MKQFVMMALVAVMMTSCMSVNIGNSAKDDTPTQVPEANKVTAMQPFDEVTETRENPRASLVIAR